MKKPICKHCGEYKICSCRFDKCALCGVSYSNYDIDEEHQIFEYRGVLGCSKCIEEVRKRRDYQRQQVIKQTEKAISSQRKGEFANNHKKYNINNVASDGLPIIKIKEPLSLKNYEDGKL